LVHGFNTEFEYAIRRAGQLTHDMRFDGVMIAFNWISQARLLDYMADLNEAQLGADRLSDFLRILANSVKADKISLIAHSMGTHVVLGAVERYLLRLRLRPTL
jgi:esterase/lipase superfamily enzyme